MTAHTPAPWKLNNNVLEIHNNQHVICKVLYWSGSENAGEPESNARLIAAAPTMYEYIQRQAKNGDLEAQSIINMLD